MKRLLTTFGIAFLATGLGYVAHQLLAWKDEPPADGTPQLVVGVPVIPAVVTTLVGLAAGKTLAAVVGFIGTALTGTRLDDLLPGVADARRRMMAQFGDGAHT